MSTKPAEKPNVVKPPVDKSNTYIWIVLIFSAIAICTRVKFAWSGNDYQAVAIEITSRIGKEQVGNSNFKNVIHLTIGNPFTTENLDRVKEFGSGKKEVQGEFLNYEFSVTPKDKLKSSPKPDVKH
jgi:hypothetical protein